MAEVEKFQIGEKEIEELLNIYATLEPTDIEITSPPSKLRMIRSIRALEELLSRRWLTVNFKIKD